MARAHTRIDIAKMMVPARVTKAFEACQARIPIARGTGMRYGGSSMTNVDGSPRTRNSRRTSATSTAARTPTKYIATKTRPWTGSPRNVVAGISAPITIV